MLHILMHQQSNAFASFIPGLAVVRNPPQWENKLFPFGSQDWRFFWFSIFLDNLLSVPTDSTPFYHAQPTWSRQFIAVFPHP